MNGTKLIRNVLENNWQTVLDVFGNDEKMTFICGTALALLVPFCLFNAFFLFVDLSGKMSSLEAYKVQKTKNNPVDMKRLIQCCMVAGKNELTNCALLFLAYPILKQCGMTSANPLPPIWRAVPEYYLLMVIEEMIFYYSHRILHWPPLYKRFHKMHHEWTAPVSMSTSYSHPLDNLFTKFLPYFVPPMVLGSHLSLIWLRVIQGQIATVVVHSGYHLPFLPSPQYHDYHHMRFNECFGAAAFLDWLHSTDSQFRRSIFFKRHLTYYGLSPITERFPSENKKEN